MSLLESVRKAMAKRSTIGPLMAPKRVVNGVRNELPLIQTVTKGGSGNGAVMKGSVMHEGGASPMGGASSSTCNTEGEKGAAALPSSLTTQDLEEVTPTPSNKDGKVAEVADCVARVEVMHGGGMMEVMHGDMVNEGVPPSPRQNIPTIDQEALKYDLLRLEYESVKAQLEDLQKARVGAGVSYASVVAGQAQSFYKGCTKLNYCAPMTVDGKKRAVVPKSVVASGKSFWQPTMVGYFVDGRPPIPVVIKEAWSLWKEKGLMKVLVNDSGFFFFRFKDEEAMKAAFDVEIMAFLGHTMVLEQWRESNVYNKMNRPEVPRWCKLTCIPLEMWNLEGISHIAR